MKRIFFAVITSLLFVFSLYPQNRISLEFTGGVISPIKSYDGLMGKIQVNYSYSNDNNLYASFSYSSWAKNKVIIHDPDGQTFNDVYSEDNHSLYSILIGNRMIFYRYKTFSVFNEFELGYQGLNYTRSFPQRIINPDGTIEYLTDYSLSQNITENLLGLGVGLGIKNSISTKVDLLISIKLNSYLNSSYNGLFGRTNSYFSFSGGFLFNI